MPREVELRAQAQEIRGRPRHSIDAPAPSRPGPRCALPRNISSPSTSGGETMP